MMGRTMIRTGLIALVVFLGNLAIALCPAPVWAAQEPTAASSQPSGPKAYAGSSSCRECHEKFYKLWSTSRHGLAMQPYTPAFARNQLTPQQKDVVIGTFRYSADIEEGAVIETGPQGQKRYRIGQVMGNKNVYYFLTPLDKGRLQTLPVAYDVRKKEWFDTAASGVRHFPGGGEGRPVDWRESAYTFNSACYGCHVSQLSTNYDPEKDAYHTVWAEPGINCETCHGPAGEHNKIARATPKGRPLLELRIIRTKTMTKAERNDLCSSCHAKAGPLTVEYKPGERFFDHFDLTTLEDPDYYPDGRDLGENYTLTSWLLSPCARSGQLDCIHCHTSSGRYRFKEAAKANDACLPCHAERVKNAAAHTHHQEGSPGSRCISCHMPMTGFAQMTRSDHSMLPPAPAATIAFKSPNACNLCHTDKDAAWADKQVRAWQTRDYQEPVLERAALIDAARERDWTKLPEMLAYIKSKDRDQVFAASLIRLLMAAPDERITPVLLTAAHDPSPLVRSSAVQALSLRPSQEALQEVLAATGDEYRIVRIRAAAGLAGFPLDQLPGEAQESAEKARKEYLAFLMARPDQWTSHYNMGNYRIGCGELQEAVASYRAALKLEPRAALAMVNLAIAYARMGENDKAEKFLHAALKTAPGSAAANFNMGLLQAEKGELEQAESYLKKAVQADPQMAQAAYNLCVITAKDRLNEAISWCRKATDLRPEEPKYGFTLAFYLNQRGERDEAVRALQTIVAQHPGYKDAEMLLQEISGDGR
jgi:tetratricopeptide (TPR) repeat protein